MAPTTSGGEYSQIADAHQWAVIRLRLTSLVLTVAIALVTMRLNAQAHALWVLLVLPLFWSADTRLCGLAESYRTQERVRPADETFDATVSPALGYDLEIAAASPAAWSSYRTEFYSLLAFAPIVVLLQR